MADDRWFSAFCTITTNMLYRCLFYVLIPLSLAFLITWFKVLDRAKVELGLEHYAEKGDPKSFLKMPANALVNIGYSILGMYWIIFARRSEKKLGTEVIFYYIFSWMSVCYGVVQFGRIVSQTRMFAIIDQWVTLPFFAWVVCWNEFVYRQSLWQSSRLLFYMRISFFSYFCVLLHEYGFEFVLGVHILAAVIYTIRTQGRVGTKLSMKYFCFAILCCAGFVFLKLADHYLGQFSYFQRFSGHFWSKVCDIGQVHFVCKYFQGLRVVPKESKGLSEKMKKKILNERKDLWNLMVCLPESSKISYHTQVVKVCPLYTSKV